MSLIVLRFWRDGQVHATPRHVQTMRCAALAIMMLLATVTLPGCSSPKGLLDDEEAKIGLGTLPVLDTNLRVNHSALLDPQGVHLRSPGFIIGIERINEPFGGHRITHIVRYDVPRDPVGIGTTQCRLFSLFTPKPDRYLDEELSPWCPVVARPQNSKEGNEEYLTSHVGDQPPVIPFRASLEDMLRKGNFTHIMVIVMGWNTDQEKSVKNFNELSTNLIMASRAAHAGGPPVKPLVIGVSWDSLWALGGKIPQIPDLLQASSLFSKKKLAEEVGRRFLTPVVMDILEARENAARQLPIVMIGHSFGARAFAFMLRHEVIPETTDSADVPDRLYPVPPTVKWAFQSKDKMIMLQGAFDIVHLFDRGALVDVLASKRLKLTLTASDFDTANGAAAVFAGFAGARETYDRVCGMGGRGLGSNAVADIGCGDAIDPAHVPAYWGLALCNPYDKAIVPARPIRDQTVHYLDASKMINCQTPFGGGGSHDDFYRPEVGRFLYNEVKG